MQRVHDFPTPATVTLMWDPPAGVSNITGYRILRTFNDRHPYQLAGVSEKTGAVYRNDYTRFAYEIDRTGANTTFYVDGRNRDIGVLSNGPHFRYFVVAITTEGDSFPAQVEVTRLTARPTATATPAAPTLLASTYGQNNFFVRLDWNDPGDPAVYGYEIQYRDSTTDSWTTLVSNAGNVHDFSDSTTPFFGWGEDMSPAQLKRALTMRFAPHPQFRIRALSSVGASAWSNTAQPQ